MFRRSRRNALQSAPRPPPRVEVSAVMRRRCPRKTFHHSRDFGGKIFEDASFDLSILCVPTKSLTWRALATRSMRVASHPAARAAHPGCRVRGARGTRSPRPCRRLLRARAAEAGRADPADRVARERADDVPAALRAWCAATRGGVDATVADIDALRRLVASAETASGSASDAAFAEPASSCLPEASSSPSPSSSSERWRLLGAAQRTEPSPGSWLASPFFWFAKEAQHESYEIAIADEDPNQPQKKSVSVANATTRLAARLSAGWDDPRSGERWVTAFGAREATAAFPFSVVEGALNAFRVPFESGKATVVTFETTEGTNTRDTAMTLESRVRVRFGNPDARVGVFRARDGDLVTRCALETRTNANANERERTRTESKKVVRRSPRLHRVRELRGRRFRSSVCVGGCAQRRDHGRPDASFEARARSERRLRETGRAVQSRARRRRRRRRRRRVRGDGDHPRVRARGKGHIPLTRVTLTRARRRVKEFGVA